MKFKAVIPARFASTRLHGKPLADIAGKPMVVRVAERALASGAHEVVIATDHEGVRKAAESHGFTALMTRADHASGTDRLAEVAAQCGWSDNEVVVNVQGDEPLIDSTLIRTVAEHLGMRDSAVVATAAHAVKSIEDFLNPNVVKLVCDREGYALYFSRAPIPWPRDAFAKTRDSLPSSMPVWRHIGLYAYRAGFLRLYTQLSPSPLETAESLEQLRVLWHGYRIAVALSDTAPESGVDTAEDLERVRRHFTAGGRRD